MLKPVMRNSISASTLSAAAKAAVAMWLAQSPQAPAAAAPPCVGPAGLKAAK